MSELSRYYNVVNHVFRTKVLARHRKYRDYQFSDEQRARIVSFIGQLKTNSVFVFAGLRQVKHSLGIDDPFKFILSLLIPQFESIIVPAFTPSVRTKGSFDVSTSPSEVGAFSSKFLQIADYRTLSPLKSYAVVGPAADSMKKLQYLDDFGPKGSYRYLITEKVSVINIGTSEPRLSCIHFVEHLARVPYCTMVQHQIQLTDQRGNTELAHVSDIHHLRKYKNNLFKIERDLLKHGLLSKIQINDLTLRILPEQRYFCFLMDRVKKNPYYLVD